MTEDLVHGGRFILTNRMNLNGILSSRIIGPREAFAKYYQDLLQLTPGVVPVLSAAPSEDLVRYVSKKVRTGPALLELAPDSVPGPVAPVALVGAVPFDDVVALHLPDETSMREHLARRYNNIHPHDDLLKVSPDLFTGTVTHDDVTDASKSQHGDDHVAKPAVIGRVPTWQLVDRIRGGMSAAVVSATNETTLLTAAALLPGGAGNAGWLSRFLHGTEDPAAQQPDDLVRQPHFVIYVPSSAVRRRL